VKFLHFLLLSFQKTTTTTMKPSSFYLALAATLLFGGVVAAATENAEAAITPQVLPCAAAAALRASFSPPSPSPFAVPASCRSCDVELVSLSGGGGGGGGGASSSSSAAPLRFGINAVSLKGMEPGVWEAVASCAEQGCSVAAAAVAVMAVAKEEGNEKSSTSSSLSSTARFPFLVQQCNGTLSDSMEEMDVLFVVSKAQRDEAGKGKGGGGGLLPPSLSTKRGVATVAALAASQAGLVALAVA
jgi:hypothetical protein